MEKEVFDILVDWNCDEKGAKTVTSVALGDFDIAFKLQEGALLHTPHTIGNAMWRSPKGQTGRGITKASDIFSFGLVCIYALGAGEVLLINNYQELLQLGMTAEQEILVRHLSYFGPVNQGLLKQINDGKWATALSSAPQLAELDVADRPELSFEQWGQELGSGAQDLIAGMTRIDPTARATIYQVLAHKWWHEEG
ncbi:hypothetical protein CC86DRAFT_398389 [Ophiobolus disseminans]|uniref:Protein kinase domain-containing protein n=1 Tax=Ophiobolus disseminans TaxID=1469910 RepID=A0A6A6ZFD4_9PLEO|nr:hypothetical protein CC86DRAFT_398389 [Ophiobolus disseminans]